MWCAKTFPTHVFHIRLDLRYPLEDPECRFVLSLGALACWSDEDFIGRVARAERRTHSLAIVATLKKVLIEFAFQWQKASRKASKRSDPAGLPG